VNNKKILITTESHEIFVLRTDRRDRAYGQCGVCDREVEIVTIDQAISLSGIRTGELVRMAESDRVHAIETSTGHLLICRESLELVKDSEPEVSSNERIIQSKSG
jgi:hypothetical protein